MHYDIALNKFRTDHSIPDDIQIERSGPNEDANLVKGNENRISVQIWMIHHAGLWFSISPMLKEVMACCCLTFMQVLVNFVRTVLAIDTLMCQQELHFSA